MRKTISLSQTIPGVLSEKENLFSKQKQMDKIEKFVKVSKDILGEENIQTIILFGSKSTGTDDVWSDYDFHVVTGKEFGWDEKFEIYRRLDFTVDIILRTYSEMEEGIRSFSSIDIYALYFGKIVYGKELNAQKERIVNLLERGEIVLRPELGKGVIEYGART